MHSMEDETVETGEVVSDASLEQEEESPALLPLGEGIVSHHNLGLVQHHHSKDLKLQQGEDEKIDVQAKTQALYSVWNTYCMRDEQGRVKRKEFLAVYYASVPYEFWFGESWVGRLLNSNHDITETTNGELDLDASMQLKSVGRKRKAEGEKPKKSKKHGRTQFKGWRLLAEVVPEDDNLYSLHLHKLCTEKNLPFLTNTQDNRVRLAGEALQILHKIQSSTILQNQYKHQWRDILLNMMGDRSSIDLSALREVSNFDCLFLWKHTELIACSKGYTPPAMRVFDPEGSIVIELCIWNLEHTMELEMDHIFISLKPQDKIAKSSLYLHMPSYVTKSGELAIDQTTQVRIKVPSEFDIESVDVKEAEDRLLIILPLKKHAKRKTLTPTKLGSYKEIPYLE